MHIQARRWFRVLSLLGILAAVLLLLCSSINVVVVEDLGVPASVSIVYIIDTVTGLTS